MFYVNNNSPRVNESSTTCTKIGRYCSRWIAVDVHKPRPFMESTFFSVRNVRDKISSFIFISTNCSWKKYQFKHFTTISLSTCGSLANSSNMAQEKRKVPESAKCTVECIQPLMCCCCCDFSSSSLGREHGMKRFS